MRDSMIFYRSFYEAIKDLSPEQQGIVYNAIFTYGFDFIEVELNGVLKTVWTLIKPQLDANIKRFNNGKTQKQTRSKPEANQKQNESKMQANNNNNVNNNVNDIPTYSDFINYAKTLPIYKPTLDYSITAKYNAWVSDGWKDGNGNKIKNWKTKLQNTLPHLKEVAQQTSNTPPKGFI